MKTFSDIYEAMRKEKYSENLQALQKTFIKEVAEYFNERKTFLENNKEEFSDLNQKNKKKYENAITSFKELIRIRKKKILQLGFVASEVGINKKDYENLLSHEKELFENIVRNLEKGEKELQEELSGAQTKETKHKLVRFKEEIPEFLDFEGNEIGPFKKGEIANIENEIIEILEKDNRIELLEED